MDNSNYSFNDYEYLDSLSEITTTHRFFLTHDINENSNNSVAETYNEPKRDSLWIVIPITLIYGLILLTGLIGNICTCIVISKNRSMHTATNYYLFSLAVSDLLLLITGLPQEIYYLWSHYPYIFGEAFCVLRGLAAETSANATVLTITAFTIERYVAICHPFLSHTMSKLSRAIKLILLIWVISLLCAVPQALQLGIVYYENDPEKSMCIVAREIVSHSFELSTFLFFVTPMTLITVLYVLIGMKLKRSAVMKKESVASCNSMISTSRHYHSGRTSSVGCRKQCQSSRKVLKMLVAVVVAFFVCWAPFHVQRLVAIYGSPSNTHEQPGMLLVYEIVTYISGILYYLSTTVNPLLYHIMSNKFREAFKETLSKWFHLPCKCQRRGQQQRTYSFLSRHQRQYTLAGNKLQTDNSTTDYSGNSDRIETYNLSYHRNIRPETSFTDCSGISGVSKFSQGQVEINNCNRQAYRLSFSPRGFNYSETSLAASSDDDIQISHYVSRASQGHSPKQRKVGRVWKGDTCDNRMKHTITVSTKSRSRSLWKMLNCVRYDPTNETGKDRCAIELTFGRTNTDVSLTPTRISDDNSLRSFES